MASPVVRSVRRVAVLGVVAILTVAGLGACTGSPGPDRTTGASPAPPARGVGLVTGAAQDRRVFYDGAGKPLLLQTQTLWDATKDLSLAQTLEELKHCAAQGFDAVLLTPYPWTGAPDDRGTTVDGLAPFDGDVAHLDAAYWARFDKVLAAARGLGITVIIATGGAPLGYEAHGYAYDETWAGELGAALGRRYRGVPGIMWLLGVDYNPQDWSQYDPMMQDFARGLRAGGSTQPLSVQLMNPSTTSDDAAWRGVSDFESVYTYQPTYEAARRAVQQGTGPVWLAEANFEGENNEGGPATTDETLRRQALWALTSGASGVTYGNSAVWQFEDGWKDERDTTAVRQLQQIVALVRSLPWWTLRPDVDGTFLRSGTGVQPAQGTQNGGAVDVLESDRATASVAADGSTALVYLPTPRSVGLDVERLAPGVRASWYDPASGRSTTATLDGRMTPPAGDHDWLLVVRSE